MMQYHIYSMFKVGANGG